VCSSGSRPTLRCSERVATPLPELPDITVYCEALAARTVGATPERARVVGVSLLRTVDPPLREASWQARSRRVRFLDGDAAPHRGEHEEARGAPARESHVEAIPDGSDCLQRHRERLLRRDPASRAPLARRAHAAARRARARPALRGHPDHADRLGGTATPGGGGGFPEKVTAFRDGMAVHGRYRQPCPDCGSPVQRIVRGEHETNYCARCQTAGKVLADRALSRLLGEDRPRTLEEWEERRCPPGR